MPTKAQLTAELARLHAENEFLKKDMAYGGLNKNGLLLEYDRRKAAGQYFVFCDLDGIHDLNRALGEPVVDQMIKAAFEFTTREQDIAFNMVLFGRVESGDEEGFIINGDPAGFIARLHANLAANGLSGIAAYTPIENHDLLAALDKTRTEVNVAKNARGASRV